MRDIERLCVRTGAKPALGTVRHKTLPQDVVFPNKDAGMALYPTWRVLYPGLDMRRDNRPDGERTKRRRRRASSGHATSQRYTVHEAALLLGLSVDAVLKRAEWGSLKREKDSADGTVYILLDTDHPASGQETSQYADGDETSTSHLVDSLQDQVNYLRRELDLRNEELRRKDHLPAALERIPALEEATSVSRESDVSASEERGGTDLIPGGPRPGEARFVVA